MISYIIFQSKNIRDFKSLSEKIKGYVDRVTIEKYDSLVVQEMADKKTLILLYYTNRGFPLNKNSEFLIQESNFKIVDGYVYNLNSNSILDLTQDDINSLSSSGKLGGEYSAISTNNQSIDIVRDVGGLYNVYYLVGSDYVVISNRPNYLLFDDNGRFDLSIDFCREFLGLGYAFSTNSMYSKVKLCDRFNRYSIIDGELVSVPINNDLFFDNEISNIREKSDSDFYDFLFYETKSRIKIVNSLVPENMDRKFYLSGGMDSRLLLSLFDKDDRDKVNFASSGPPFSHDVVTSKYIAKNLNLKFSTSDSIFSELPFSKLMPGHLYKTNLRVSPMGFQRLSDVRRGVNFSGHDAGLRESKTANYRYENSYGYLFSELKKRYNNFDLIDVLLPDSLKHVHSAAEEIFEKCYSTTFNKENVFNYFHKVSRFYHYVSFIKHGDSMGASFAPYLLMNDAIFKGSYLAGADDRKIAKIHFELMRRGNKWLAEDCPFGGQHWDYSLLPDQKYPFKVFLNKYAPRTGAISSLENYRSEIFEHLKNTKDSIVFDVVDKSKLLAFKDKPISFLNSQVIFNALAIIYAESCDSAVSLRNEVVEDTSTFQPSGIYSGSRKELTDAEFSDKRFCNTLLEKATRLDLYELAIQDLCETIEELPDTSFLIKIADAAHSKGEMSKFKEYITAAAVSGSARAMYRLGVLLFSSDDEDSLNRGIYWLNKAFSNNDTNSLVYFSDQIIKKNQKFLKYFSFDLNDAFAMMIQAFEAGDKWIIERISGFLKENPDFVGVSKYSVDYLDRQALDFFVSISGTNSFASYRAGDMYLSGVGCDIDFAKAKHYFEISAAAGNKLAITKLEAING
jgi:hypothetical protein